MQYDDILLKIKQDRNNAHRTDLYRYLGLLEAIRFFANRLTLEQITDNAFDFVNELLTVSKSVMYLLGDGKYELKKQRGINNAVETINFTPELLNFALYVGNVINDRNALKRYFDDTVLESLGAAVMLPLVLEDKLYGFFLLSDRIDDTFNESDILVCEALMKLFNNAMENCTRLERLQISNRELDEKIFNLFAINQSAKAMLTEHRLDELYTLSVDVFSELTQSAHTGFILFDEPSEKFVLKAYRDVFKSGDSDLDNIALEVNAHAVPGKNILDLSIPHDMTYFCNLFDGGAELISMLNAFYIVFIYGDNQKLLGFVTLGQTVTGVPYKKSAFELVDSLASYTCIALSNAMLLETVNNQKMLLQKKLDRLVTLNNLSKNINSALDTQSIIELTLETLTVSFGVESSLITLYDKDNNSLCVRHSNDLSLTGISIPFSDRLEPLKSGRIIFESSSESIPLVIGEEIAGVIGCNSGVLAIPLTLERYETIFIGAIIIFKLNDGILSDEENVLLFETIANHISPLIAGFMSLEEQKMLYRHDLAKVFIADLERQIEECAKFDFDLEIIRITDNEATPYNESSVHKILSELIKQVYQVSYKQTEVIVQQDFEYNYRIIEGALVSKNVVIKKLRFKHDFNDLEGFLKIE